MKQITLSALVASMLLAQSGVLYADDAMTIPLKRISMETAMTIAKGAIDFSFFSFCFSFSLCVFLSSTF